MLTRYGTIKTPIGDYALLRPVPFMPEPDQGVNEVMYYIGDVDIYGAISDPEKLKVSGTYEVHILIKPFEVAVTVPDDFQKEEELPYTINMKDETKFRYDKTYDEYIMSLIPNN
jgi:hypothetical protein